MIVASMPTPAIILMVCVVALVFFVAGWVLADARSRGLPRRKALTWAALQGVEFPLFFWLYRRIRPRRIKPGKSA
ncbi:MAG: hypothetical protein WBQ14_07090 [Gaiellaceae bacterium]